MMVFKKTHISSILSILATLAAGITVSACFDIPSKPSERNSVKGVSIYTKQGGKVDSTLLKIHPQETAEIFVKANPDKYTEDLNYIWFKEKTENVDIWLGAGETYFLPKNVSADSIPNKLVVKDAENNSFVSYFNIVINTPPKIDSVIAPQQSDTLYGNTNTSFQFEWTSHDKDNEDLTYTILIDSIPYNVGEFKSVRQSGFSAGEHTFQVIVADNYGDTDSSDVISFHVTTNKGDKK